MIARLTPIVSDEAATLADIAREMIRAGDVRGWTVSRVVEEWERAQPIVLDDDSPFSVRVDRLDVRRLKREVERRLRVVDGESA